MRTSESKAMRQERIRVGAKIANALPKMAGLQEVADTLGISTTAVKNIECLALWKIQHRLKELGIKL